MLVWIFKKNTLLNAGDIQLVGGFNPLEKY